MKRLLVLATCALIVPGMAHAATHTFDTGAFEAVSVAAGLEAEITLGARRSVVAETHANHFDDLRIAVKAGVLHIDRPARSWFSFRRRPDYKLRIVMPKLHSLAASSGARVILQGGVDADLSVKASSGGTVSASLSKGENVEAHASSGSLIRIAGSCLSLEASASSGARLDAEDLDCDDVVVKASSGSNVSVTAKRRIAIKASSGSSTRVSGKPASVQTDKSSGADVMIR